MALTRSDSPNMNQEREGHVEPDTDAASRATRTGLWSRRRLGCLLLLAVPVVLIANEWLVRPLLNPLRRSPEAIAADLREQTPLGASRAAVEEWVSRHGWPKGGIVHNREGLLRIESILGEYETFGFMIFVHAEWWFAGGDQLETVRVYKFVGNAP